MKINRTINSVVGRELCTGCGTCVGLCPKEAIKMIKDNRKGIYVPRLEEEKCNRCGICFHVCPGHAVDFHKLNLETFGRQPGDPLLGNYLNCYIGYANDCDIRYHAASGGIVTALLVFALSEGLIDGALVTKMREDNPLEPQPFIARTKEEIISAAKSKYCPVPANVALKEILQEDGRFAVVGLPCHIHGIRKAEQVCKELKEKIALRLGIFCAHTDSFTGTEFVLRKYGVRRQDVVRLDYRGEGWPGYMSIIFKNGEKRQIPFTDYISLLHGGFFTLMRCALCCDQTAELADISCGDAWLPEIMKQDRVGTSVIVSRNATGQALLERALAKGTVMLTDIESDRVQGGVAKRVHYAARSQVARLLGNKVPTYETEILQAIPSTYYSVLGLFARRFLSRRYLQWLIIPFLGLHGLAGKFIERLRH